MYLDAAYDFEIGIQAREEGCLALEVLARRRCDALEDVRYRENV